MNKRITCGVVQDLLPSYLEGLTSQESNEAIELHLGACPSCQEIKQNMEHPICVDGKADFEAKSVDYLKKIKRHSAHKAAIAATLAVGIIILVFIIKCYAVGFSSAHISEYKLFNVPLKDAGDKQVELSVQGRLSDEWMVMRGFDVRIEGDTVYLSLKTRLALPWAADPYVSLNYRLPADVKYLYLSGHLIWDNGTKITQRISGLYQTKHDYVGSMPENGETADALGIALQFGRYKNVLQTAKEPYGWTFEFDQPVQNESEFNHKMTQNAYFLMAMTGNLGEVSWTYHNSTEMERRTVTASDATGKLGHDIKSYGKSAAKLQQLADYLYMGQ